MSFFNRIWAHDLLHIRVTQWHEWSMQRFSSMVNAIAPLANCRCAIRYDDAFEVCERERELLLFGKDMNVHLLLCATRALTMIS